MFLHINSATDRFAIFPTPSLWSSLLVIDGSLRITCFSRLFYNIALYQTLMRDWLYEGSTNTENWELLWYQLCHHWWHHKLSLWQLVVPPVKTKLASWWPCFQCKLVQHPSLQNKYTTLKPVNCQDSNFIFKISSMTTLCFQCSLIEKPSDINSYFMTQIKQVNCDIEHKNTITYFMTWVLYLAVVCFPYIFTQVKSCVLLNMKRFTTFTIAVPFHSDFFQVPCFAFWHFFIPWKCHCF